MHNCPGKHELPKFHFRKTEKLGLTNHKEAKDIIKASAPKKAFRPQRSKGKGVRVD